MLTDHDHGVATSLHCNTNIQVAAGDSSAVGLAHDCASSPLFSAGPRMVTNEVLMPYQGLQSGQNPIQPNVPCLV